MQQLSLGLTIAGLGILLASSIDATSFKSPWSHSNSGLATNSVLASNSSAPGENACYLTVAIPENAGQSLSKLSFTQEFSNEDTLPIQFDLAKTTAFVGTPEAMGNPVGAVNTALDETLTLWVEFDPSVAPGTTFTVALEPEQPLASERYEFVITAYPDSEEPIPQFLGDVTLGVNSNNDCQFLLAQESN